MTIFGREENLWKNYPMPVNITVADITVIDPAFQDFIQFFILVLTVASILLAYNSAIFIFLVKSKEEYLMVPTRGLYLLFSTVVVVLCLVGSCASILTFFISISVFTLNLVSLASEIILAFLFVAIVLMAPDVFYFVRYLLSD